MAVSEFMDQVAQFYISTTSEGLAVLYTAQRDSLFPRDGIGIQLFRAYIGDRKRK